MPKLDTVIITPWIAGDPENPDEALRANRPQLATDYPHITQAAATRLDTVGACDLVSAYEAAAGAGPGFRSQFGAMAETGALGVGVRIPQHMWDMLQAEAEAEQIPVIAKYPMVMGPVEDPASTEYELYRMLLTVEQEGVRLWEDVTGQTTEQIVPDPNQYSVRAIVDETVLSAIDANPIYYYMSGVTIPDDPENPSGTPASPIEKPPTQAMTQQQVDDYQAWQRGGTTGGAETSLPEQARGIVNDGATPTFGETTVVTAAWQSQLERSGANARRPASVQSIARMLDAGLRNFIEETKLKNHVRRALEVERKRKADDRRRNDQRRRRVAPVTPRPQPDQIL